VDNGFAQPSTVALVAELGPFKKAFRRHRRLRVPPYLVLLHLMQDGPAALGVIKRASAKRGAGDASKSMLASPEWRAHLVAAVAASIRRYPGDVVALWDAADRGSWVAPQLVAVLSMLDDDFRAEATDRLRHRCPIRDEPSDRIEDAPLRHVVRGPGRPADRSAKLASALMALLRDSDPDAPVVVEFDDDVELQQLFALDIDNGGTIAVEWRRDLRQLLSTHH
jgi:hypothetical protein